MPTQKPNDEVKLDILRCLSECSSPQEAPNVVETIGELHPDYAGWCNQAEQWKQLEND